MTSAPTSTTSPQQVTTPTMSAGLAALAGATAAPTTAQHEAGVGRRGGSTHIATLVDEQAAHPTTEQVWRALARASFAILSHVTPTGAPRSSGVVYTAVGQRLYAAVAPESWKARHIATGQQVAVTVPVRRGGVLSLLVPIPPATISFHGTTIVHPAGSLELQALQGLDRLVPAERRASATVLEIVPEGRFLTYGISVPLMRMANPAAARAHVPVS